MEYGLAGKAAVITGAGAWARDAWRIWFAAAMRRLAPGRVNAPEGVSAVILFLASDRPRQVTGADYVVNAGSATFV